MKIEAMTKERVLNFRSFLIAAIFVAVSIYCSLIMTAVLWLGILLLCLNLAVCLSFVVFFFLKRKKCGGFKCVTFIITLFLACAAFISFMSINNNWSSEIDDYAQLDGMIEVDRTSEASRQIILSRVKINGIAVSGRVQLYVVNSGKLDSGTLISIYAHVKNVNLVNGFSVDGNAFRNNIRYNGQVESVSQNDITDKVYPGLIISLREKIYLRLSRAMGDKNGGIAYGMVVGEKTYISNEVLTYFNISGLRHLLAVSGLHLSMVCSLLTVLFLRLRFNRKLIAAINSIVIVFYVFLAGFSPSVLRSAVMGLLGVYFFLSGDERDLLNTLGFAFAFILTFAPFFLFEAGFILSVSCIYGLALFSNPISNFLINRVFKVKGMPDEARNPKHADRRKFFRSTNRKRGILRAISATFSIQLGIFPACVYIFKSFQAYSFIVNLLMIPFAVIIFAAILISLVFSFLTTLDFPLTVCGLGIDGLDFVAQLVSKLPYASIIVYSTPLIFVCYLLYFIMSGFVIKQKQALICVLCLIQCVVLVAVQNSPAVKTNSIAAIHFPYSSVSMISVNNDNYVVGDFWSGSAIRNRLKALRVRSVKGVFVNSLDEAIAQQLIVFSDTFGGIEVYFPIKGVAKDTINKLGQSNKIKLIGFEDDGEDIIERIQLVGGFHALFENNVFRAYGVNDGNASIIFVPHRVVFTTIKDISQYNIIRTNRYFYQQNGDIDAVFLVNESDYEGDAVISYTKYKDYAFDYEKGLVYIPK